MLVVVLVTFVVTWFPSLFMEFVYYNPGKYVSTIRTTIGDIVFFSKWSVTFTEFSEFRENDNH